MPSSQPSAPPAPELTHLYTLHCKVNNALYTASVPGGTRRVYPIKGGTFSGPRISGTVLDLGADWGLVEGKAGIFQADTRYCLKTSDGTHIYVRTSGPSQPESSGGGLHLRGLFEVGEGSPWWWLNFVVAIGRTQKVDEFEGGFTLKIDMWYMSSPNDQLTSTPYAQGSSAKI